MEMAQLGQALENQSTVEMRKELEQEGVEVPSGDALLALSHKFTEWLSEYRTKTGKESSNWASLVKEMDVDGSGFMTFDELQKVVRWKLDIRSSRVPDITLKSLWCALDVDNSNQCTRDEVAAFFKLAERDRPGLKRQSTSFVSRGAKDTDKAHDQELAQLNRAVDSQSTVEMRKELEQDGVSIPDAPALLALSHKFTAWISEYRYNERKETHSWSNLFKELDKDGSGYVTFDELQAAVRRMLCVRPTTLSKQSLKAMWCALDLDDSNQITGDEMARFFRLAERDKSKSSMKKGNKSFITRGESSVKEAKAREIAQSSRAIDSQPTSEMKKELKAAGVELPSEDELMAIAKKFVAWIEDYKYKEHLDPSHSWANLFKTVDEDGSGFLSFDELLKVMRTRLQVKPTAMSDTNIKALWCVLDADESNQVQADEMAGFFRKGESVLTERKLKRRPASFSTKAQGKETLAHAKAVEMAKLGQVIQSQATKDMRAELQAKGVELPGDEELTDLSKEFTRWLEDYRYKAKLGTQTGWGVLFKTVDEDRSGFVTYDELQNVLREKLAVKPKTMPEEKLRALWCVLDADNSNQVQPDELSKFFRRAEPQIKTGGKSTRQPLSRQKDASVKEERPTSSERADGDKAERSRSPSPGPSPTITPRLSIKAQKRAKAEIAKTEEKKQGSTDQGDASLGKAEKVPSATEPPPDMVSVAGPSLLTACPANGQGNNGSWAGPNPPKSSQSPRRKRSNRRLGVFSGVDTLFFPTSVTSVANSCDQALPSFAQVSPLQEDNDVDDEILNYISNVDRLAESQRLTRTPMPPSFMRTTAPSPRVVMAPYVLPRSMSPMLVTSVHNSPARLMALPSPRPHPILPLLEYAPKMVEAGTLPAAWLRARGIRRDGQLLTTAASP